MANFFRDNAWRSEHCDVAVKSNVKRRANDIGIFGIDEVPVEK
jgi:hypothetical protein